MIIGLIGLKNSGKDTLVSLLQKRNPTTKIYNLKFARGLKKIVEEYFNIPKSVYENTELKEKKIKHLNKTPRDLMISIGSYFRSIDPDCWVNYVDNYFWDLYNSELEEYHNEDYKKVMYIFTDVRFENEISYLKSKKAILIDVERESLYEKEKKLIKKYGANCLTKQILKFKGSSITDKSEWCYFKNRKKCDYHLINSNLKNTVIDLENILNI